MGKAGPSAAAERRDGSRGGNRKSKSPPCVCKERRHKDEAPSELKCGKGWASPLRALGVKIAVVAKRGR